jgi:Tfp pilus assembly protein FimT
MPGTSAPRSSSGISIAHIASFLAVVALFSCIAIPLFFGQPKVTLDSAAILLAQDLRLAQNEAVLASQTTSLALDENGDGYAIEYSSGRVLANPVGGEDLRRVYSFDAIFRGVQIEAVKDSASLVSFSRDGFSLNGASFRLEYGDETRLVHVAKGNGEISIDGLHSPFDDSGL